jgi:hypothetical protein
MTLSHRANARRSLWLAILAVSSTSLSAQDRSGRFMENCRDRRGRDSESYCETRDFTLGAVKTLSVDGRENGGIVVHGWDKNTIQIVAMVQTQDHTEAEARALAREITIITNGGDIRAEGPRRTGGGRRQSWSVSYEVWAPRRTDLRLTASNGGLSVDGLDSRMDLETTNGGLNLTDVDGDVRGVTTNGGVTVELSGDRWRGAGLDVRTTNGGVHFRIPNNYSARLETGTVNGGMDLGIPITVQGNIGRRLTTQLGSGGATIRAMTTNGGVSIRQRQ